MTKVIITISNPDPDDPRALEVEADYYPDYPDETPAKDLPATHQLAVMLMGAAEYALHGYAFAPTDEHDA